MVVKNIPPDKLFLNQKVGIFFLISAQKQVVGTH